MYADDIYLADSKGLEGPDAGARHGGQGSVWAAKVQGKGTGQNGGNERQELCRLSHVCPRKRC